MDTIARPAQAAKKATAHPPTSAADYIAGVLGRGAAREQMHPLRRALRM